MFVIGVVNCLPGKTIFQTVFFTTSCLKMPELASYEDFEKNADRMVAESDPSRFRFNIKYRHCDGGLSLTVTDDRERFRYSTNLAQDVKKLEKLYNKLLRKMMDKTQW